MSLYVHEVGKLTCCNSVFDAVFFHSATSINASAVLLAVIRLLERIIYKEEVKQQNTFDKFLIKATVSHVLKHITDGPNIVEYNNYNRQKNK